jgi:hypothetical protein
MPAFRVGSSVKWLPVDGVFSAFLMREDSIGNWESSPGSSRWSENTGKAMRVFVYYIRNPVTLSYHIKFILNTLYTSGSCYSEFKLGVLI